MKELNHLSDIYKNYDTFIIDLWGVIHNGIALNPKAIVAIEQLKNNSKKIVFLSNAPRPSSKVVNFLLKMNMERKYLSNVMTSGEAAMHAINKNQFGKTFFHLGPPRDTSVFEKVKEADFEVGYNAANNELVNMFEIGIIDPAKVTRSTLQNAASIASMVLTTECIIVDKPNEMGVV